MVIYCKWCWHWRWFQPLSFSNNQCRLVRDSKYLPRYFYVNALGSPMEEELLADTVEIKTRQQAHWKEYRRRRLAFLILLITYVPGVFVTGVGLSILFKATVLFYVMAILWLLFLFVSSLRLALFKCPQCGNPFFSRWWYYNPLAQTCVHCGLRKWT